MNDKSEKCRRTMAAVFRFCISNKNIDIIKFSLLQDFMQLFTDHDIEVKKQAFLSMTQVCKQYPSLMRKFCTLNMMKSFDRTLPYDKRYVEIVQLGGFNQETDKALILRRICFQFMIDYFYVIVKKIEPKELMKRIMIGINDKKMEI